MWLCEVWKKDIELDGWNGRLFPLLVSYKLPSCVTAELTFYRDKYDYDESSSHIFILKHTQLNIGQKSKLNIYGA